MGIFRKEEDVDFSGTDFSALNKRDVRQVKAISHEEHFGRYNSGQLIDLLHQLTTSAINEGNKNRLHELTLRIEAIIAVLKQRKDPRGAIRPVS